MLSSLFAKHSQGIWLLVTALIASALGFCSLAYFDLAASQRSTGYIPVSLDSKQVAGYSADPRPTQFPAARIDLIADVIRDQEPDANAAARFATVQANLLTPVAWLISPTPTRTRTATPTRTSTTTPSPTPTATPADPWISLWYARVGCNFEVSFAPVAARKLRFQLISGGGKDNHVSFYCCGSSGAAFWVNGNWVHVTNQSIALDVGESRETDEVNAVVNRARFNVGCNDKEPVQVQVFYLPLSTPSPPTPALSPTLSPQPVMRSATPSATFAPQTRPPMVTPATPSR